MNWLFSCAVCMAPGHITAEAMGWAILVLLCILLPLLGGIIAVFVSIARKAKRVAALEAENEDLEPSTS